MAENRGQISRKKFGVGMRASRAGNSGAPPAKHRRKTWYDGPPFVVKQTSKGFCECSSRFSYRKKAKAV